MPQRKTSLPAENNEELPFVDYDFPSPKTRWNGLMLVGEAPGREEAKLGHPFVGRSGQLLNRVLKDADIEREDCLVANVFRLQPPGNKVNHFFLSRRAAQQQGIGIDESLGSFSSLWCRTDFSLEIKVLAQTIEKWKPKIILALGRTPFWALTGEDGLLSKVGQKRPCSLCPGFTVLPTYHPSFILRGNWGLQTQWCEHFVAASQHVA